MEQEIKGLAYENDMIDLLSTDAQEETIDRPIIVEGNLYVSGDIIETNPEPEPPEYEIVTFQDGTDEQIAAMLDAHYAGLINIEDYWNVGDIRKIHLNAIAKTENNTTYHNAQDIWVTIIGFNHDDLVGSVGTRDKAAVTLNLREVLGNNGTAENEYFWGPSGTEWADTDSYAMNPFRNFLNHEFVDSMPETFNSLIKTVHKNHMARHTSTTGSPLRTSDKAYLLSYPEVFGSTGYSYYKGNATIEEEQFSYFVSSSNRIKYPNRNGQNGSSVTSWFLRSPSSGQQPQARYYCWCYVTGGGNIDYDDSPGGDSLGIAPAFSI